jgi:hypothetical protein
MSVTNLTTISDQIQKFWSPLFTKQLREKLLLGGLVNKDYSGAINKGGDTVKVSQINAPQGELLTVGVNADSFNSEAMSTTQIEIKADKRAVASYEFEDLVELQSQIESSNPEVRDSLMFAIDKQINDYLYTLIAPTTTVTSVTDFNSSQMSNIRKLAGQAKWMNNKPWYLLVDPAYYTDILDDTTLASSDFGGQDRPVIAGQVSLPRFGFNILEDNSRTADYGLAFHPDFLHMVMQQEARVKISDQHAQKKFGFVMSVDIVFGAKLGIDGAAKHIKIED